MRAPLLSVAGADDRVPLLAVLRDGIPAWLQDSVREPLLAALAGSEEEQCIVARDRMGGSVTGFALFGLVPGTFGAGRVRAVATNPLARRRGVGRALLQVALGELREAGARLVVAEVPDEPGMSYFVALLSASGFVQESSVPDLVRDGVAMRYFVWRG